MGVRTLQQQGIAAQLRPCALENQPCLVWLQCFVPSLMALRARDDQDLGLPAALFEYASMPFYVATDRYGLHTPEHDVSSPA